MRPASNWVLVGVGFACTCGSTARLDAAVEALMVPNGSFESPATDFISLPIEFWQRIPKPDWYVEEGGFQWRQLTGIFANTATTKPDHIVNMDGRQAGWVFAVPEAGLFQGVRTATGSGPARFEPGRAYRLSVDVLGGSGNMLPGVTLDLSLFRWDAASNRVPVMTLTVTNSVELFPINTRFDRFSKSTTVVRAGDPWAGAEIGVQVVSTATQSNQGGYWDIDRVIVESIPEHRPVLALGGSPEAIRVEWMSEPGWRYRLRSSSGLDVWTEGTEEWVGTGSVLSVPVGTVAADAVFFDVVARPPG